jgi:hypothetical protein
MIRVTLLLVLICGLRNADANFAKTVQPFMTTYCVACHGAKKQKAKIRVDELDGSMDDRAEAELWGRILESLEFGEMPSDKAEKFPTNAEARSVQDWISEALTAQGLKVPDKSTDEGYGNLVPHELLFSPQERMRTIDAAARLWRISPNALTELISRGGRARMVTNPFALEKPHGNFRDFKGKYPLNSLMAEQIAELAIEAARNSVSNSMKTHKQAVEKGRSPQQAYRDVLLRYFQNLTRRTANELELEPLLALLKRVNDELGEPRGLTAAYAAIILQPESIFRYEATAGARDGLIALTPSELAHALAHALTDRQADTRILRNFEAEKPLREILAAETKRLLAEHRHVPARQLQFFQEFFDYEKAVDVFKDKTPGHEHWAPALVRSLDMLVTHTLEADKQVFKTLLTTQDYFISVNSHTDYGAPLSFNLSPDWKVTDKPQHFPANQRMGVLTHPAWLVAHSGNFDNDPIRRGHWIRYKLLGGNVPDIPINVDAKLPEDKTMTLRQRMHVTHEDECYKCHSKMNPLGLPFEQFDHFGRFRFSELKKPVDTSSVLTNTGVAGIDGSVKSPFELIERLAASPHVGQVFVRHAFRFYLGRNETLGDAKTLQDADAAYVASDGSMKALVLSLLTSDSFFYRAAPERSAR